MCLTVLSFQKTLLFIKFAPITSALGARGLYDPLRSPVHARQVALHRRLSRRVRLLLTDTIPFAVFVGVWRSFLAVYKSARGDACTTMHRHITLMQVIPYALTWFFRTTLRLTGGSQGAPAILLPSLASELHFLDVGTEEGQRPC